MSIVLDDFLIMQFEAPRGQLHDERLGSWENSIVLSFIQTGCFLLVNFCLNMIQPVSGDFPVV